MNFHQIESTTILFKHMRLCSGINKLLNTKLRSTDKTPLHEHEKALETKRREAKIIQVKRKPLIIYLLETNSLEHDFTLNCSRLQIRRQSYEDSNPYEEQKLSKASCWMTRTMNFRTKITIADLPDCARILDELEQKSFI